MVDLDQWLQAVNYGVTEGWRVFNSNYMYAYSCEKQDENNEYVCSLICEFNRLSKEVDVIEAHDYINKRAYRWINPKYVKIYRKNFESRGLDFKKAYDDTNFIDLETESDILSKTLSIYEGFPYDDRVEIPLNLEKNDLFELMSLAHEKDVTLNQYVTDLLDGYIANFNGKLPEPLK